MLATLAEAQSQRWSWVEELLARNAELTHELLRAFVATWGGENVQIPDALRIPRPGEEPAKPELVSLRDLGRQMSRGR